jgi:hypothetical protein
MGRLERRFLDRIELNSLNLDLENGRQFTDRTVLLYGFTIDRHLLHVKRAIDRSVDVARPRCHVDFDIRPQLLFGSCSPLSSDVRDSLAIEQTAGNVFVSPLALPRPKTPNCTYSLI